MMHNQPWPRPEQDREERAQTIAKSYRDSCLDNMREFLDNYWKQFEGTEWIDPGWDPYDELDWVRAADAAMYFHVAPGTVRKWAERKHIRTMMDSDGTPLYNIGDIREYRGRRRQARLANGPRKQR